MPFRLRGELPAAWLESWWREAARRHGALRATFGEDQGVPCQTVHADFEPAFVTHDVRGWKEPDVTAHILAVHRSAQALETDGAYSLHVFRRGDRDRTLLMRSHHIIVDLGSEDTLFADLRDHLSRHGAPAPPVPTSARTYAAFVARQRQQLEGREGDRLARFWEDTLRGAPLLLEVPGDRPRTGRRAPRGRSFGFELLDAASTERLRALCTASRTSPFRALLAIWAAFLHQHTGQDDLLIGVPADCRGADFEGVVGNFVNLMVIRVRVGGAASFRELLASTGDSVRSAAAHRDYPFPMLVDRLVRTHHPGSSPLVQTSFNLTRLQRCPELEGILWPAPGPRWRGELAGLGAESEEPVPAQEGHFELGLTAVEVGSRLVGELKYDAVVFNRSTIERFASRVTALLVAAITTPDRPLRELPRLSAAERQLVQVAWNATQQPFTSTTCQALIERQIDRTPDAVALRYDTTSLTYRELDARANALAHRLQRLGVGVDVLVGIYHPRSCDAVVVMLAILKAGGAYLPLDLATPAERLALVLADARPSLVVTSRAVESALPSGVPRLVLDGADADDLGPEGVARPESGASARSLAYVIYTSGSTGTPKGVLIEHRGVCNLAESLARCWQLDASSCLYCYASFGFDASVADIFPTLVSGATLHLGSSAGPLAGPELHAFMRGAGVSHVTLTPAVWASLPAGPLPALRVAVSAGEACIPATVERWRPSRRFYNNYGPTEITVCATIGECTDAESALSIGRPMANVRAYVLDERLELVAVGVPGELYLGGVGVARGYLRRPELTALHFLDDPFVAGARVYRTGDIARWRGDGTLEYLGRRDTQVKLRGHRIELGEIEALLRQEPAVTDGCVVVHGAATDRALLVAYVVSEAPHPAPEVLRAALARSVPDYMVPARILVIDEMPLTSSGKVDRGALARRKLPPATSTTTRTPPASALETKVSTIWARLLRLDAVPHPAVAREDDFFALGGDSLLALLLAHEVGLATGSTVAPRLLSQSPTLEAFCRALAEWDGSAATTFGVLRPAASEAPPLSLHFLPAVGGDASVYAALVERLPPRVRALGPSGIAAPSSFAELARAYAASIDRAADDADISLAGWSTGGVLALSVAHELERQGRHVARVVLLDARLPLASGPTLAPAFFAVLPDLDGAAEALSALPAEELQSIGAALLELPPDARATAARALALEHGIGPPASPWPSSLSALLRAQGRALEHHEAPLIDAELLVVWSAHTVALEAATPWARYTRGRVVEHVVGGHHYSLLRAPTVEEVASLF